MANICYTKFKVESSEKEVEALRKALNKREGKKLTSYLRYCRLAPLTEASVQKLPHGGEVLSFETATNWGPELREWTGIIRARAPHAQVVYYAEEFGQRDHETNDIWGKYFPAPYAVYAHISDKTPEALRKAFTVGAEYRSREDQYGWFLYLSPREVRGRIRLCLPHAHGYTSQLIDALEDALMEHQWTTDVRIDRIERVENPMIRNEPCWYCGELARLEEDIRCKDKMLEKYEERFGPLPLEDWVLPAYQDAKLDA